MNKAKRWYLQRDAEWTETCKRYPPLQWTYGGGAVRLVALDGTFGHLFVGNDGYVMDVKGLFELRDAINDMFGEEVA